MRQLAPGLTGVVKDEVVDAHVEAVVVHPLAQREGSMAPTWGARRRPVCGGRGLSCPRGGSAGSGGKQCAEQLHGTRAHSCPLVALSRVHKCSARSLLGARPDMALQAVERGP